MMDITNQNKALEQNNSLLALTHLSQLLSYLTGIGGLVAPLVIWLSTKDTISGMDHHGKAIVNFQLSMLLYSLLSIPAVLLFGLGIISLLFIGVVAFILPIINAIKASRGEVPSYILSIQFIA